MANRPAACTAADVFSDFKIRGEQEKKKTVLADKKMST